MNSIAFAVIVLVVLGLAGGIILVLASKFMAVYEDPRRCQSHRGCQRYYGH